MSNTLRTSLTIVVVVALTSLLIGAAVAIGRDAPAAVTVASRADDRGLDRVSAADDDPAGHDDGTLDQGPGDVSVDDDPAIDDDGTADQGPGDDDDVDGIEDRAGIDDDHAEDDHGGHGAEDHDGADDHGGHGEDHEDHHGSDDD